MKRDKNYWLGKYTKNELLHQRYISGIVARKFNVQLAIDEVLGINTALIEWDRIHR